jgi:sarcosine oxidase subunit beta
MSERGDTIICRCEEITLAEIHEAIDAGCRSVGAVKRYSRAGMGPCQGRGCGKTIADMIAHRAGINRNSLGPDKPRFPTVPVPASSIGTIRENGLSGEAACWNDRPSFETDKSGQTGPASHKRLRSRYDALVIGAGYHGTSIAWQLAGAGVRTLLIEKNEIGTGASGNNFGCVQLQDSNPGLSFILNSRGFDRMKTIHKELEADIEYRPAGSLIFARTDEEMAELEHIYTEKRALGLDISLLGPSGIKKIEPYMDVSTMKGATFFPQAQINPFRYLFAMAAKGRAAGLDIREHSAVESILTENGKCTGVLLSDGEIIDADIVTAAAGAWTPKLCATCGVHVPVDYVIGESFVSEPVRDHVMTFTSSASFFTTAHGSEGPAASFTACQTAAGNILIGETSEPGPADPDLAVQRTSATHCRTMPAFLAELYPALKNLSLMRSWTTCSPSAPDFEPFLGPAGPEGLFLAAGFKSSVVISGIVGEIIRDLVTRGKTFCDISEFNRERVRW